MYIIPKSLFWYCLKLTLLRDDVLFCIFTLDIMSSVFTRSEKLVLILRNYQDSNSHTSVF